MTGLIDGSLSTLAPIFAVALLIPQFRVALLLALATIASISAALGVVG